MEVEQLFVTMSVSKSKSSKRHVLEDVDWMSERKRRRKDSVRYTKLKRIVILLGPTCGTDRHGTMAAVVHRAWWVWFRD